MSELNFFHRYNGKYTIFDTRLDECVGKPARVSPRWDQVPENPDAAINWGNSRIYFFKGEHYYRFNTLGNRVDKGPVKIQNGWPGLKTDGVDAALHWRTGGRAKVYFFRGDQFWRYDVVDDKVDDDYPKTLDVRANGNWKKLFQPDLQAAINWGDGRSYFFKGSRYARLMTSNHTVNKTAEIKAGWDGLFTSDVQAPVMLGYAGIDMKNYPGDKVMHRLLTSTNLRWTGFYLTPSPSQATISGSNSWMDRYYTLATMGNGWGWGFAPIYVGEQQPGSAPGASHNISSSKGFKDATHATELGDEAGLRGGSIIYLDIETGPPLSQAMLDYYGSWVQGIIDEGVYRPGVYCSYLVAKALYEEDDRPAFWVFRIRKLADKYKTPFPCPEPLLSSVPFASSWQHRQDIKIELPNGRALKRVDLNTSSVLDPSTDPSTG